MEYPCAEKGLKFGDITVVVRARWQRWPDSEPPGGTTEISVTVMRDGMDARIVKTAVFRKTSWPLRGLEHEIPRYAEAEAKQAVTTFLRWLGLALTDDIWQLFLELDDFYHFRPIASLRELTSLDFVANLRDVGCVADPLFTALTHLLCAIHVWRWKTGIDVDTRSLRVRLGEQLLKFAERGDARFTDFTPKEVSANA